MEELYYKTDYIPDKRRSIVWKEIVRYLKSFIPKRGAVLDLGAGYCDFINNIVAQDKYAVDISSELSRFASSDVKTTNSKAWDLSAIGSGSINVVHASNLFEHFTDEELDMVMKEVRRVLKSKGVLILMQPNWRFAYKNYFDDITHKKVFSDTALEIFLLSHNFEIIFKKARFLPFSFRSGPAVFPIFPLLVRAYLYSPFKPFAGQMLFVAEKND